MEWTNQRKMLLSFGLTGTAAALALIARKPWSLPAALGMAISTVGDGVLAGYPPFLRPRENRLVWGGAVFFIAHLVYMAALCMAAGRNMAALTPFLGLPVLAFVLLTALQGGLWRVRGASGAFFAAAWGYLLIAGLHAALAMCVCAATGRMALNVAGAALFYLSDSVLLIARMGTAHDKTARFLVWPAYTAAQLCLMLGFFLA